jgi:hypothetical protein
MVPPGGIVVGVETTKRTFALAPLARSPSSQVTVLSTTGPQVPWLGVVRTRVVPGARVKLIDTSAAVPSPVFVTVMMRSALAPAVTVSGWPSDVIAIVATDVTVIGAASPVGATV